MVSTQEEILALFKKAAARELDVNNRAYEQMTFESSIQEFGVDSLALLEIVGHVEDALQVRVPNDDFVEIRTVQDLIDAIVRVQRQQEKGAGSASVTVESE